MSFITEIDKYSDFNFNEYLQNIREKDIKSSLERQKPNNFDLLNLLSPKAGSFLEEMAVKAHTLTIRNFGKTIQLYIPLYLSDYCTNECIYCGFNRKNKIRRTKLSYNEIEQNAVKISETGIRHILLLTGEAPELTPLTYLLKSVEILKKYFSSISIEIFPMDTDSYKLLKNAGVDGLTVYQEVYDRSIYDKVHLSGKKKDYLFRLDTPERGALAGFRSINIGPLYGLGNPLTEAFFCGLHAAYLQNKFLDAEISLSLPRINYAEGNFKALNPLDDKRFIQLILALRLFLPRAGITISTRENASFRDHLVPVGITKMSAGSNTSVGGYIYCNKTRSAQQFEISDGRSVSEIAGMIAGHGYEPVFKDWDIL